MNVLGIDPGVTGALALVTNRSAEVHDTPTFVQSNGKRDYAISAIRELIESMDIELVAIEKVTPRPARGASGWSAVANFRLGGSYYVWRTCCGLLIPDVPIVEVSASAWKKKLGLDSCKESSRTMATSTFPALSYELRRKKDHNRAEALLLAHWARLEVASS